MNGVDFERPEILGALLLFPVLMYLWVWGARRAGRGVRRLWRRGGGAAANLQALLLLAAAASAIVAAAQPTWGTRDVPVIRSGADVIFILDISRSMDATDIQPSRLAAAKAAIVETLERTGGARVGLVVFGGSAHLRIPLSTDPDAVAAVISSIETSLTTVEGGSEIAAALDLARGAFDEESDAGRLAVLITDGENRGPDPAPAAVRLQIDDASLLVLGVGTTEGATIPVPGNVDGPAVLEDQNGPITTRLDEATLRNVARAGQGRYLENNLDSLPGAVVSRLAALETAEIDRAPAELPVERFTVFAGIALAAAGFSALTDLLAMALTHRKSRRVAAALAAGLVSLVLLGACAERSYELNEEGLEAFERGDLDAAREAFEAAALEEPGDMEIVLNLAFTLHAQGNYRDAALAAERVARSTDRDLRARGLMALGHHWFADGNVPASLDAFRRALLLDPGNHVARHDYEVVLRSIEPPSDPDGGQGGGPAPTPSVPPPSPTPGGEPSPGDQGQTPQPGTTPVPDRGASPEELESRIAALDEQIRELEEAEELSLEETLEFLELVAERNRLSELLESAPRARDPENR